MSAVKKASTKLSSVHRASMPSMNACSLPAKPMSQRLQWIFEPPSPLLSSLTLYRRCSHRAWNQLQGLFHRYAQQPVELHRSHVNFKCLCSSLGMSPRMAPLQDLASLSIWSTRSWPSKETGIAITESSELSKTALAPPMSLAFSKCGNRALKALIIHPGCS